LELDKGTEGDTIKAYHEDDIDSGGLGDQGRACGGKPDQIISWLSNCHLQMG